MQFLRDSVAVVPFSPRHAGVPRLRGLTRQNLPPSRGVWRRDSTPRPRGRPLPQALVNRSPRGGALPQALVDGDVAVVVGVGVDPVAKTLVGGDARRGPVVRPVACTLLQWLSLVSSPPPPALLPPRWGVLCGATRSNHIVGLQFCRL